MDRKNIEHWGYGLFLARLDELKQTLKKEVLPFSDVYEKLCRNFSISKQLCRKILNKLAMDGYIEYVNSHGIKITEFTEMMFVYLEGKDVEV